MSKNRDLATEQWIQQWTDAFELRNVRIADIDRKKSQHVQNRPTKLDANHALQIGIWLEDDPEHVTAAIVVNDVSKGGSSIKYLVADGNHRVEGHSQSSRATIDAYVVKVDQDTYEGMVKTANLRNAKGLTYAERIEIAIGLKAQFGSKIAAAQALLAPEVLNHEIRITQGRTKVEENLGQSAQGPGWSKSKLEAINRLEPELLKNMDGEVLAKASAKDVAAAVNNVLNVPPSMQRDEAISQSGVLEGELIRKRTPRSRAKTVLTPAKLRKQWRDQSVYLRNNPAVMNDKETAAVFADLEIARYGNANQNAA